MSISAKLNDITMRIARRSRSSRAQYLQHLEDQYRDGPRRNRLSEGNLAHASAGCPLHDKQKILGASWPNLGIVTAFNDMLSAHQPFEDYPKIIKEAARQAGATAQVAGGVPAMCDGVTQGQPGMELSLFSRDVIALSSAVGLSHDSFDAAIHLGVCDKIVPGLVIAALRFGWVPSIFAAAGPMPSGLPNKEKQRVRQLFAEGKVDRDELLQAESQSYHSPGTCTFYGTANTNQMLMEIMGLQLPGSSFINPGTRLREAMTQLTTRRAIAISTQGDEFTPAGKVIDEKAIVNGIAGLMATGGSTNLTIHIIAMARAAGVLINWDDLSDMSSIVPLIARVYPNGQADVNHFHAAGGMAYLISSLLSDGLLHADVTTVAGSGGLTRYCEEPKLLEGEITYGPGPAQSGDTDILASLETPFREDGGLRLLSGNLGRSIIKVAAVRRAHQSVTAPARIFDDQEELIKAFQAGELTSDMIAVVRFQGPAANGMPELHKLTPILGVLQDRGLKVALVTDGRMSGASGKVPAAIHICPEALHGGPLSRLRDGDMIQLDAPSGTLNVLVDEAVFEARQPDAAPRPRHLAALGQNMFGHLRGAVSSAEEGATILGVL